MGNGGSPFEGVRCAQRSPQDLSRRQFIRRVALAGAAAGALTGTYPVRSASAGEAPALGRALDKIKRSGQFSVGARQGVFPFGYLDKSSNSWVGFSTELAREVHASIEKELKTTIKLNLVSVTSRTRIPLLQNGTTDLDAGTTVVTVGRDKVVDSSIPFFVTGLELLVPKGSPIKSYKDLAGKRMSTVQGGFDSDTYGELNKTGAISPAVNVIAYQDQPDAFQALVNGAVEAQSSDGVILAGLRQRAPKPDDWTIIDTRLTSELYAFFMRRSDSDFRHLVNATLVALFKSGGYQKYYDKYFGPHGGLPLPLSADMQSMLYMNSWPK